ncbi:hypothetical protein ABPG72_008522 [Tetrahymena utriculariae]
MQWAATSGTKTIDLRFKNTYVNFQIGTLFQSIESQKKLLFSSDKEMITDYNKNDIIFELNLFLENNKESVYNIKQQTLVQLFSSIGGLVNSFIFNFQLDQNQQELEQQESPPIQLDNQKSQITENNNNNNCNTINHTYRPILKQSFKFKFNRSHTIQTSQTAREPLNSEITNEAYNNSIFRKNKLAKEIEELKNSELFNSNSIVQKSENNQNEFQIENKQNKDQTTFINQDQTLNDISTINFNYNQLSNQKRRCKTQKLEDLAISDINK